MAEKDLVPPCESGEKFKGVKKSDKNVEKSLEEQLKIAVEEEDYLKAAELRDAIAKNNPVGE